jgi:sugar transferase (PEP-CTERM/EpsH1 system associated)
MSRRPLIAHIVFRFDVGGLENGVVNLINRLPENEFDHAIIALTQASDFRTRIRRGDVTVHALDKKPGQDPATYVRLYRLLRQLRPQVVHTRNLGTLECQLVACMAGVSARIHGEHGWDVHDPDGLNRKYRAMRRAISPAVHRFVTVSRDLHRWLTDKVGIPGRKVQQICNGVDISRFRPRGTQSTSAGLPASPFPPQAVIVGSVTRFEPIKDPMNLARAFIDARKRLTDVDLRLLMVGDGPLRADVLQLLESAGEARNAWLPGAHSNVDAWLRTMDIYALGSRREGISNTVLEAMASGLPVIASATGGNLELVEAGTTGALMPPENSAALADALTRYAQDASLRAQHGAAARARAERLFSLEAMVAGYTDLYRGATAPVKVAA